MLNTTNLPTLTGSDKQIAWATDIRNQIITRYDLVRSDIVTKLADESLRPVARENYTEALALLDNGITAVNDLTSAETYINRSRDWNTNSGYFFAVGQLKREARDGQGFTREDEAKWMYSDAAQIVQNFYAKRRFTEVK